MHFHSVVVAVTGVGDLAVLLPLSAAIFVWLLWAQRQREALRWLIAVLFAAGGTGLLKIYFLSCPLAGDLHSPSGHTAFSTLVYGALALLVASNLRGWRRWAVVAAGAGLVGAIAGTRLLLGFHTVEEVFLGLMMGLVGLVLFRGHPLDRFGGRAPLKPLLFAAVLLIAILDGHQLRAEEVLHAISTYLLATSGVCT